MTEFKKLIQVLLESQVEFIIIGGAAATAHGSARLTLDLDILYRRSDENISNLVHALRPFSPYLRGAPPGLPFVWSAETIRSGLNFTLITSIGAIDLLGEVTGGGNYESMQLETTPLELFGFRTKCLTLDALIRIKRACGRPKDLEVIAELEALKQERKS